MGGGRERTFAFSIRPSPENEGMDRALLKQYLEQGLSLSQIGVRVDRDPSTVGYWVQKHGLVANGRAKHAPKGGIPREVLEPLVEGGSSIREVAQLLDVSIATVRHWLKRYGLKTKSRAGRRFAGPKPALITDECPRHGQTDFILEGRGSYRCRRCRSECVSRWRRRLKRTLIDEAGGRCAICGYDRHPNALQFHHLDPAVKAFALSQEGITRSLAAARAEAAKCVLLCANCHAEVEAGAASLVLE